MSAPDESGPKISVAPPPAPPRKKRRVFGWVVLILLVAAIVWVITSSNPFAEGLQELGGYKHDQAIVESPFSVSPHNVRYYKFTLPEGSTNVMIVGQFATSAEEKNATDQTAEAKDQGQSTEGIEVYVLSEAAFAIWQKGYATGMIFESGRVTHGDVKGELPEGPGVYYLVFSNRFDAKASKKVNASVLLRYKSWFLPELFRKIRGFF